MTNEGTGRREERNGGKEEKRGGEAGEGEAGGDRSKEGVHPSVPSRIGELFPPQTTTNSHSSSYPLPPSFCSQPLRPQPPFPPLIPPSSFYPPPARPLLPLLPLQRLPSSQLLRSGLHLNNSRSYHATAYSPAALRSHILVLLSDASLYRTVSSTIEDHDVTTMMSQPRRRSCRRVACTTTSTFASITVFYHNVTYITTSPLPRRRYERITSTPSSFPHLDAINTTNLTHTTPSVIPPQLPVPHDPTRASIPADKPKVPQRPPT